jgi:hypothetical protein
MRWLAIAGMLLLASAAGAAGLRDPGSFASPIAFEQVSVPEPGMLAPPVEPGLVLAQRVIDREWTTRADSLSNPNYVTGGKSEMGALAMSAAVPGAGQLYSGERNGFIYMAAEVVAIASAVFLHNKGDEFRSDAANVAGVPADSASGWSANRWASATAGDPKTALALYEADPEAYYDKIAKDPTMAAGWASGSTKDQFVTLRDESDLRLHRASIAAAGIWINHVVSAVDALRAARLYNLPLRRGMEIKGNARWKKDGPAVRFAVVQKF